MKFAILKNVTEHVPPPPPPESPEPDTYDRLMIRPETKTMRMLRWIVGSILIIVIICVMIYLAVLFLFSGAPEGSSRLEHFVVFSLISFVFLSLLYFAVKGTLNHGYKNRLTITDNELLIQSPRMSLWAGPDPIKLEYRINQIVDVSIKHPGSPELESVMSEDKGSFKLDRNQSLYYTYPIHRSSYYYLLSIGDNPPFPDGTQFVDIEFLDGWRILVEFDDAENFVRVLKRRIAK